ncbi:hypothetical protein ES702_07252 [subsurface metagenome]
MSIAKIAKLGVIYHDPLKADNGYTLFCPAGTKDVWLIDMEGHIVHHWRVPYNISGKVLLLPHGNLLVACRAKTAEELGLPHEFSGLGGLFLEVDWDGNLVWQAEVPYQSHDFQFMDNGHVIFNSFHPSGILPDEIAVRVKGGRPGTELDGKIWGDSLPEIDRDGKTVWEWKAYEHLDPEIDAICMLENRSQWPYINSVWFCRDGNILLSTRYLNQVTKIEYPSGRVIGRYGRGRLAHQHDCRDLDNGNILLFDNGSHRHNYEPSYSRAVEIDPNTDEIVWEYKADPPCDFYSACCSGCERLPNGNTVICDSEIGRIFEVTKKGELVWEYISPFVAPFIIGGGLSSMIWRAQRYSRDYSGLKGKDLDPARYPWENLTFGPGAFKKDFKPAVF